MPRVPSGSQSDLPGAARTASRVMQILELLATDRQGLSLRDINRRLNIPWSSLHTLVQPLLAQRYLARDDGDLVRLGPRFTLLTSRFIGGLELVSAAEPVVDAVSRLSGETVGVAILEGSHLVVVHQKTSDSASHIMTRVGVSRPAHTTASGKVILAQLSPEEIDRRYPSERLESDGPGGITAKTRLLAELRTVKAAGIAFNREESNAGVCAMASAVLDRFGKPIGAMGITALAARVDSALEARLASLIQAAALVTSYTLGYAPPGVSSPVGMELLEATWESGAPAATVRS